MRTIGLSDVVTSDSDLSIRHLELTPNTSENSFRLTPHRLQCCESSASKHSKESIDSGCQNETHNGENIRNDDPWHAHCDFNILDIKKCTSDNNHRKMDTLDLTGGNYRKSSSSTLSDVSSCSTNRSVSVCETKKQKDAPKYHSAVRSRLRRDTLVSRSKSFQEQDVRKKSNHARFYILRRNNQQHHNDFDDFKLNKTISHHNIEITIEDTDANEQPINHSPNVQRRRKTGRNEWSSINSDDIHSNQNQQKIRSGHVLGRIFRRMRKLSMAWRKSKTKPKPRTRGEFEHFITLHSLVTQLTQRKYIYIYHIHNNKHQTISVLSCELIEHFNNLITWSSYRWTDWLL